MQTFCVGVDEGDERAEEGMGRGSVPRCAIRQDVPGLGGTPCRERPGAPSVQNCADPGGHGGSISTLQVVVSTVYL